MVKKLSCPNPNGRISVINTDNVPANGDVIRKHILHIVKSQQGGNEQGSDASGDSFLKFLEQDGVSFHNSMVDRITSQRPDSNGMVPRCEPVPAKALVIEDLRSDLPPSLSEPAIKKNFGVVVRKSVGQLGGDIALKLRVANATHTAIAHTMALSSLLLTDALSVADDKSAGPLLLKYLDSMFGAQILPGARKLYGLDETRAVYADWRKRLCHAHFGLSTFFITQNGAAKGGIRIAPTIRSLLCSRDGEAGVTASTVFSLAAILRFLTPSPTTSTPLDGVYIGWLDSAVRTKTFDLEKADRSVTYADGLRHNIVEGWYEFKCSCMVDSPSEGVNVPLTDVLGNLVTKEFLQPNEVEDVVIAYLVSKEGGDMNDLRKNPATSNDFKAMSCAVATLYARMLVGDQLLDLLKEMEDKCGVYESLGLGTPCQSLVDNPRFEHCDEQPLHYRISPVPDHSSLMSYTVGTSDINAIEHVVTSEVASAETIDLHTHLLPPSHGLLCLWGIDELLTYHYLVAEYFMTASPSISPELFYAKSKREQADLIWKALFKDRSPVSEACRGVLTTLQAFGLSRAIQNRDLEEVRKFYSSFRDDGLAGAERFSELVYRVAGVSYAIMTNIPFDANESQHWRPKKKVFTKQYRSALRVDPLLAGDRSTIEISLRASGYDVTLEGARQYLRDWIDTINPEYMMASTPHNFDWSSSNTGPLVGVKKLGVNEDALKEPFAFVDMTSKGVGIECEGEEDETASIIDESSDFLSEVLMAVCEEKDLPIALKIGAKRGVNPALLTAGDGIVAFASGEILARLCVRFPKVRFLATFLSRNNQHEACVLASKFRNLHIYGCWWFCNNPSMIHEITTMRVEMMGTAFTAQHSDARVLDQLIYKWSHSRSVIAAVLVKQYKALVKSGWFATRKEIRRDIKRLFGGSYEDFMAKSFTKME